MGKIVKTVDRKRRKRTGFTKNGNKPMRWAVYFNECRKSNLFCDSAVWQKKQSLSVMIGTERRNHKMQCCGKEELMEEKIVQREGKERPEEYNRLFKLPKHIKQMGLPGNNPEIYIEDYAEGYLRRLAGSDYTECRVAVLVGEFVKVEGKRYVFIRGAIEAEEVWKENAICFTSEVWASVYEKIKRYFPQYEAVGWFLGGPEFLTEITEEVRQIHVDWFGGRDRVLYRVDPVEKEATFYLYDKGELKQWPGYCVYYEKNEEMQDFLVAGAPPSVDAGYTEPVLVELGKRVGRKSDEDEEEIQSNREETGKGEEERRQEGPSGEKRTRKTSSGHGTGFAAAVALLAIGAFALREKELRQAGNIGVPTLNPTPTTTGYVQTIDEEAMQTNAGANPTAAVVTPEGTETSMFEREFVPITEEPYLTGEEREETSVTPALPEFTPVPEEEPLPEEPVIDTNTLSLYIVQNGDTLAGICQDIYGNISRMEEVKGINQISDENRIYAGQELYLP